MPGKTKGGKLWQSRNKHQPGNLWKIRDIVPLPWGTGCLHLAQLLVWLQMEHLFPCGQMESQESQRFCAWPGRGSIVHVEKNWCSMPSRLVPHHRRFFSRGWGGTSTFPWPLFGDPNSFFQGTRIPQGGPVCSAFARLFTPFAIRVLPHLLDRGSWK